MKVGRIKRRHTDRYGADGIVLSIPVESRIGPSFACPGQHRKAVVEVKIGMWLDGAFGGDVKVVSVEDVEEES